MQCFSRKTSLLFCWQESNHGSMVKVRHTMLKVQFLSKKYVLTKQTFRFSSRFWPKKKQKNVTFFIEMSFWTKHGLLEQCGKAYCLQKKKWSYVILQKFLTAPTPSPRPTLLAWLTYKVGKWLPSKSAAMLSLFSALSIFQMCSSIARGETRNKAMKQVPRQYH